MKESIIRMRSTNTQNNNHDELHGLHDLGMLGICGKQKHHPFPEDGNDPP